MHIREVAVGVRGLPHDLGRAGDRNPGIAIRYRPGIPRRKGGGELAPARNRLGVSWRDDSEDDRPQLRGTLSIEDIGIAGVRVSPIPIIVRRVPQFGDDCTLRRTGPRAVVRGLGSAAEKCLQLGEVAMRDVPFAGLLQSPKRKTSPGIQSPGTLTQQT